MSIEISINLDILRYLYYNCNCFNNFFNLYGEYIYIKFKILKGDFMSFDGITTKGVVSELTRTILGGKINKVFEPNKNEILLGIYASGTNYLLDLVINSNSFPSLSQEKRPIPFAPAKCRFILSR